MEEFKICCGLLMTAYLVVVYGPEGIGKSTFASMFPNGLFIDTEGSTKQLDVRRLPRPSTWQELLAMVAWVRAHPGVCSSLVIDSLDWALRLCVAAVCAADGRKSIEDYGYGKGYVRVAEEFCKLLALLSQVASETHVHIVVVAHATIRKFELPDAMGAFDRYELKIGDRAGSRCAQMVKEWCDMLLFCNYRVVVVTAPDGKKKVRGGARVMYTTHAPTHDAKNRFGLPDELPLEYQAIAKYIPDFYAGKGKGAAGAQAATFEAPFA